MQDTALLIIDMQTALLSDAYDVEACLRKVADLAERARSAGVPIIYLRQRLYDVPGGLMDVHQAVAPRLGDVVLDKDSADSFLDTGLGDLLDEWAVCRVIITGFSTEYCVDSTSRAALSRGYDLVLVSDGHTTPERPPGAAPSAAQVVAHHNSTFSAIRYAGRSITVTPAARVRFDTAVGSCGRRPDQRADQREAAGDVELVDGRGRPDLRCGSARTADRRSATTHGEEPDGTT
ncbi:isochorismatase family protein [Streptomyces capoamus]|uniref:isochorismatase family protein n=1 Tax=Streptomyces capoamus TaxID=68183 RepID=UPI003391AC56